MKIKYNGVKINFDQLTDHGLIDRIVRGAK